MDSNSPVLWDLVDGREQIFVLTSIDGRPSRATGSSLRAMSGAMPIELEPWPGGGVWMESVIQDEGGVWYGVFHNEIVATMCGDDPRTYPRIGMARSEDQGATWTHLGIILEASERTFACDSRNHYFVGGVGDVTAVLDAERRDLYIYFSQYGRDVAEQGIAVARLAWADRDQPAGKVTVWNDGVWLVDAPATPVFPTELAWHDDDDHVDAFWGPAIHWNAYLRQYVMLLNRSADERFAQEGVYVSFSRALHDPQGWSAPRKLLDHQSWYPQIVGLTPLGTDTVSGQYGRLFVAGRSDHVIRFER